MTPALYAGLWRRRSLAIGDGLPSEPAEVHWIQWGDRFIDLRSPRPRQPPSPLCGPGMFAGTTTWTNRVLTWHHELDSDSGGGADAGVVSWHGPQLVERGTATIDGVPTPYVEVWERMTSVLPPEGRAWTPRLGASAIEVGPHRMAAVVEPDGRWLGARSSRQPDGSWVIVGEVGACDLLRVLGPALLDES